MTDKISKFVITGDSFILENRSKLTNKIFLAGQSGSKAAIAYLDLDDNIIRSELLRVPSASKVAFIFVDQARQRIYGALIDRNGEAKQFDVQIHSEGNLNQNTIKVVPLSHFDEAEAKQHLIVYRRSD